MKTVGITAEYDPFHNGHLYHLRSALERAGADRSVVILGGDFLQRGRPGMFGKWSRVRMAVDAGADLVLELPYIYSCNSGSEYASGAMSILEGLGCVDAVSFGAETEDPELLRKAAAVSPAEKKAAGRIQAFLGMGLSWPEAVTRTVEELAGREAAAALRRPNNLLGVEYLRALQMMNSSMQPVIVKRPAALPRPDGSGRIAGHSDGAAESLSGAGKALTDAAAPDYRSDEDAAQRPRSAGEIRRLLAQGSGRAEAAASVRDAVPETTWRCLDGESLESPEEGAMLKLLLYRLRTADRRQLAEIYTVSEGLEARLLDAAAAAPASLRELVDAVRSRRYTEARIRRMLAHVLMDFRRGDFEALKGVSYARVLGFSDRGRELLRRAEKTASIPLLSNLRRLDRYDEKVRRSLELDLRAADLAAMLRGRFDQIGAEKKRVPYRKSDSIQETPPNMY